ncbi:carbohydrate kinase family protein [Mesorhizobium sp. SB112]|uniref:carbohydrate kinase family protein n=1 Tax=Mesorhizobium sp. SB112 TaxID=3151853 RepID=UPI003266E0B0
MTLPLLLTVGGAHIDRRGQVSGAYIPGASNPGTMMEDVGGGGFNALRCAVQREVRGTLISVRGGDSAGESVSKAAEAAGITDHSVVFLDRATPSYTALLDENGDVIAALADMSLYDLAFPKQMRRAKLREAVDAADAILCDANLPAKAVEALTALAGEKPVFAIGVSPAKIVRFSGALDRLSCLFMNGREAAALTHYSGTDAAELVEALRESGLKRGVVTSGADAMIAFDADGVFSLTPPAPRIVEDVTGAGDALAGATSAALMRGLPFRAALREGVAASLLALEDRSAAPKMSRQAFEAVLALVPEAASLQEEAQFGETNDA